MMMIARTVIRAGDLGGRTPTETITLDRAARYRRRISLTSDQGHGFLLDLAEAAYLADGDALVLDTGALIQVKAAAEPLVEIHAHDQAALARIAWHIGNRHTPCEVTAHALYIQPDHVLEEMVIGLGAHVHHVMRPFEPEGGAYGGKGPLESGHHHHGHAHSHDHERPQGHRLTPGHFSEKPRVWRPE